MRIKVLIISFFFVLSAFAGGDKYEIKGILSPTFETMRPGNRYFKDNWGYKLSYNFGVEYKYYFKPDVSLSTGLLYHDKGFRSVYGENQNPSLLFNNSVFVTSFKYLIVPTNINLHFEPSKKSRFLIAFGLSNGYLMSARGIYKRVSDEDVSLLKDANSDLDIEDISFNMLPYSYRRFTGINLGVKFSKYIRSKMVVEVGAMYCRQWNRASRETEATDLTGTRYYIRPKFDSFIFDIRLGYYFNKQIKNSGEF